MSTSKDAKRQTEYLRTVYEPHAEEELRTHLIDIVFVHGLNPQSKADFANATWTHENGNFWPTKQLPKRIPSARILVFSYNSQVAWDTNENGIREHANNLLDRLSGARESKHADDNYNVPIIFIAHSLGGLVVKQALVTAKNDDTYINLRKATYGLVFFAVPHQGGHGAGLGAIAKYIVLSLTGDAKNDIIESLKSNSLFQENQAAFFKHQLEDYRIVSVYENKPTKLPKFLGITKSLTIVDKKSATLGLPGTREKQLTVNSDHSEVCKFEGDDDKFDPVNRAIGTLADDAIAQQKKSATNRSHDDLHAQEHFQNFLHSLHFPAIESRQEDVTDAHKETFQWIFDDSGDALRPWSNFVMWLETGRGTYWISGKAGSGKSTLMSYICEDPRTMKSLKIWVGNKVSRLLRPKFFFWSPGSTMQKSSVGLLRSLLYQIFREYPEIAPLPVKNEPLLDWTEKRLTKVFQSITCDESSSYRMCLFIDGLDEFSGDHDALITMFCDLVQNANIKVVLSSRPYPIFEQAFGSGAMLKLQDLTKADIKKFVSDKLLAYPRFKSMAVQEPQNVSEDMVSRIARDIVWRSDGVFLWVNLAVNDQIRGINQEDSLEQLKERLEILPTRLEDLYAHMLNNLEKVYQKEAAWFLQLALFKYSDSLLDFTLATYEPLDHDLESSADFPSRNVINQCQYTSRRIATTCAGLLEVHEPTPVPDPVPTVPKDTTSEDSMSEVSMSKDSISENLILEEMMRVTFLHRTVADFLRESEQGKRFMGRNTSLNRNIDVMWAKVLIAKVRILGFAHHAYYGNPVRIESIMEAASDAEQNTGLAQTVVCDYIELAMTIQDQKRGGYSSGSHWCTRIYELNPSRYKRKPKWLMEISKNYGFHSTSNPFKEEGISRPVPERPIDFLGFAASYGLKLYIMKSLPADLHSYNVDYLVFCAIGSLHLYLYNYAPHMTPRVIDLACALLKYGVNPNMPAFGTTLWGYFLVQMFRAKLVWRMRNAPELFKEHSWTKLFKCFIENGADKHGILSTNISKHVPWSFKIDQSHLRSLPHDSSKLENKLGSWCHYDFRMNMSVPTLIRYCLGDSPTSANLLSVCMREGACYHSKCTELSFAFGEDYFRNHFRVGEELETWALSKEQSDRFVEEFEKLIVPTEVPRSIREELQYQLLLLYDELSTKGPGLIGQQKIAMNEGDSEMTE